MDYEKAYKKALERAATELETCGADESLRNMIYAIFPDELKESEDEKTRKELINFLKSPFMKENIADWKVAPWLSWLEKHTYTQRDIDDAYLKGVTDAKNELEKQGELPEGCVRKQVAEAKEALYTAEVDSEEVEQKSIGCSDMATMLKRAFGNVGKKTWGGIEVKDILTWLEMQDSQKPTTIWHDVSEVPDEMRELLVEWESPDATWHNIAFYDAETKAFRHLKQPINNVTRWAYVSDILTQTVTKINDKVWSEEDEKMSENILSHLREYYVQKKGYPYVADLNSPEMEEFGWFKTLKKRLGGK